jgi:hypothetical protein
MNEIQEKTKAESNAVAQPKRNVFLLLMLESIAANFTMANLIM